MLVLSYILHTQEQGQLREWYLWEYDTQVQECINYAQRSDPEFFLQQAKILQKRADYIRQEWAKQASQSPPAPQAPPQPISQQKKKRNQKTHDQYKRKRSQQVHMQEMEHTPRKEPGKHVVLQRIKSIIKSIIKLAVKSVAWEWLAVMHCWHAVNQWNELTMKDGMIMVELNGMPRTGIG